MHGPMAYLTRGGAQIIKVQHYYQEVLYLPGARCSTTAAHVLLQLGPMYGSIAWWNIPATAAYLAQVGCVGVAPIQTTGTAIGWYGPSVTRSNGPLSYGQRYSHKKCKIFQEICSFFELKQRM